MFKRLKISLEGYFKKLVFEAMTEHSMTIYKAIGTLRHDIVHTLLADISIDELAKMAEKAQKDGGNQYASLADAFIAIMDERKGSIRKTRGNELLHTLGEFLSIPKE